MYLIGLYQPRNSDPNLTNSIISSPKRNVTFDMNQLDTTLDSTLSNTSQSLVSKPPAYNGNYTIYNERSNRPYYDNRLLMPVISTMTTTTTTLSTSNVTSNEEIIVNEISNVNSPTTSIVDESKLLLREYEQLRSDSVSEIQRAHDSLNAR